MSKGLILKCSNSSEAACYELSVFGADVLARDEVLMVEPGDKLFLLNVDTNTLTGTFEAATKGGYRLVPQAWRGQYPYQVKIRPTNGLHTVGQAKESLAHLDIRSHWLLHDFEANALQDLLILAGAFSPVLLAPPSPDTLAQVQHGLKRERRNRGITALDHDRPALESTTLWDYPKQSYGKTPKGNNKYAGVTPAFILYNLIKRYTLPGDLVVDPMCGSGTTIDVCREERRRVIGYDIVPTRPDIIQNDARHIPLDDNSVDMVFIDSPYGDNIKYNESPLSFGTISAENEEFYDELEKVMVEAYRVLKPGKVLGWLIGDQWVKQKFTPVGFKIYDRLVRHFEPMDIISVTRRSQTSNTGMWHNRALRFNFYLRGFKYLHIVRKPIGYSPQEVNNRTVKWARYARGANE
ncbi:MAG: methyltransferase domain-containing protein [Chloroflexi bacterium]|nr:methyltransferase domain-containing protein [Chloroflexota bacterium]